MLKISLTAYGLLDKSRLDAWMRQKQAAVRKAVAAGMHDGGKSVADAARGRMQADFAVRKAGFVKSMRARVYDRDPDRLPALLIGSKIPWLGIHHRRGQSAWAETHHRDGALRRGIQRQPDGAQGLVLVARHRARPRLPAGTWSLAGSG